jgi:hypothetical protein
MVLGAFALASVDEWFIFITLFSHAPKEMSNTLLTYFLALVWCGCVSEPTTIKQRLKSMGDRGNVAIIQNEDRTERVWIYSHWGGSELPDRVRTGLIASKPRWGDNSYATKIIIGQLVPAKNWTEETGYGISCSIGDNEHPITVVDLPSERVFLIHEPQLTKQGQVPATFEPTVEWSFEDYIVRIPEAA